MDEQMEASYFLWRIKDLEEKIEQLRFSRRVLMTLIEKLEKDKTGFLKQLEKENNKLHRNNYFYAKQLLKKNRQIIELESKLKLLASNNPS